jgi:hypothetical protein
MEHDIAIDIDAGSPTIDQDLASARVEVRRFPLALNLQDVEDALEDAGLHRGSLLATLLRKSDGLLVDGGWVRIHGLSDQATGRSLAEWNTPSGWRKRWGEGIRGKLCFADDMAGNVFALNLGEDGTGNWQVFMGSAGDHSWKSLEKTFGQWFGTLLQGGHDAWYHPDTYRKMKSLETVKPVTASQAWRRKEGGIWVPADVEVLPIAEALAAPPADGEADPEAARKEAAAAIADLVPEAEDSPDDEDATTEDVNAEEASAEEAASEEGSAEEAAVAAEAADESGAEPEVDAPPN